MNPYAFITGATSGIGLATAKALAASHYDLVLAARNTEKLASVKADIEKESGVKVTTYPLDVQDREAIKEVTTKVLDTFGAPDVLVNDAGLARGLEPYSSGRYDGNDRYKHQGPFPRHPRLPSCNGERK